MFPDYCGATGLAGWLVMLLVWTALGAMAVWDITRLFPDRPPTAGPPDVQAAVVSTSRMFPVESRRR